VNTHKKKSDWSNESELSTRSTREVIEDHIQLQITGQLEEDLYRNYHADAVLLTELGHICGYDAWRDRVGALYRPAEGAYYEIESLQVQDHYAFLVWKAGSAGYVIDGAADSFVVVDGKIRMQTTRARMMQSDAGVANAG
jgi:hypothetical protein